jgi:hypothetical protein
MKEVADVFNLSLDFVLALISARGTVDPRARTQRPLMGLDKL